MRLQFTLSEDIVHIEIQCPPSYGQLLYEAPIYFSLWLHTHTPHIQMSQYFHVFQQHVLSGCIAGCLIWAQLMFIKYFSGMDSFQWFLKIAVILDPATGAPIWYFLKAFVFRQLVPYGTLPIPIFNLIIWIFLVDEAVYVK